jgi:hypothetical protein
MSTREASESESSSSELLTTLPLDADHDPSGCTAELVEGSELAGASLFGVKVGASCGLAGWVATTPDVDELAGGLEELVSECGAGGGVWRAVEDGRFATDGAASWTFLKKESRLDWDFLAPAIAHAGSSFIERAMHLGVLTFGALPGGGHSSGCSCGHYVTFHVYCVMG